MSVLIRIILRLVFETIFSYLAIMGVMAMAILLPKFFKIVEPSLMVLLAITRFVIPIILKP